MRSAPKTRWGANAPEDAAQARERLIDSAESCFERFGVAKTSIEDVATAANVSRATVYRYFEGGRDEIVLAVLLREADRFEKQLRQRLSRVRSITNYPVEGVIFAVQTARSNPRVALLFAPEVAGQTGAFVGASEVLHERVRGLIEPFIAQAQKQGIARSDLDADEAAEWLIRTVVSLLTVPSKRGIPEERRFLRHFLVPAFLASAGSRPSATVVPITGGRAARVRH